MMAATASALSLKFTFITDTPYKVNELHLISDFNRLIREPVVH